MAIINRPDNTALNTGRLGAAGTAAQSIDANITANGVRAITGPILNGVLDTMLVDINAVIQSVIESYFNLVSNNSDDIIEGNTNLFATPANLDAWFGTKTTDELTEGAANLYYTDARVLAFLTDNGYFTNVTASATGLTTTTVNVPEGNTGGTSFSFEMQDSQLRTQFNALVTQLKASALIS